MAPEKIMCEACNGLGWIPNPGMDTSDPDSPDHVDCGPCDGDGFIYEEVEDD